MDKLEELIEYHENKIKEHQIKLQKLLDKREEFKLDS